jgi:hypothetical protein
MVVMAAKCSASPGAASELEAEILKTYLLARGEPPPENRVLPRGRGQSVNAPTTQIDNNGPADEGDADQKHSPHDNRHQEHSCGCYAESIPCGYSSGLQLQLQRWREVPYPRALCRCCSWSTNRARHASEQNSNSGG